MKSLKKAKKIVKSHLSPLPVGEEWYEKRLAECLSCEYHTGNMEEDAIPTLVKIPMKTFPGKFPQGACSICGCPVDRKCSVKTEFCAMKKNGLPPKWEALEVESVKDVKVSCINLSEDKGTLTVEDRVFVLDIHEFDPKFVEVNLRIKRKGRLDFKALNVSCGCVVPKAKVIDSETIEVNVRISTVGFRQGLNEKSLFVQYWKENNTYTDTTVKFKIVKP